MFISKKEKNLILDELKMIIVKLNLLNLKIDCLSEKVGILALANIETIKVVGKISNSKKGETSCQ